MRTQVYFVSRDELEEHIQFMEGEFWVMVHPPVPTKTVVTTTPDPDGYFYEPVMPLNEVVEFLMTWTYKGPR